jgi:hypothetical protein
LSSSEWFTLFSARAGSWTEDIGKSPDQWAATA